MSNMAARSAKELALVWVLVGGGLILVAVANWHLVSVALRSEPGCVSHVRLGEGPTSAAPFSAAESSCSPEPDAGARQPDAGGLPR